MRQGRIVRDMGTHYFREVIHWRTGQPTGRRQRVNRFLCVGGPLAGAWRSSEELAHPDPNWRDYAPFNNAGSSKHSMVFIHKDLLS